MLIVISETGKKINGEVELRAEAIATSPEEKPLEATYSSVLASEVYGARACDWVRADYDVAENYLYQDGHIRSVKLTGAQWLKDYDDGQHLNRTA